MKKKFIIISVVAGVLVIGGIILLLRARRAPSIISPAGEAEKEVELAIWEDQAGFSFSYSRDIEIDPHEEDTENYAHLELTSAGHPGRILIWCQDTDYTDIEDWAEEEATEEAQILDTELNGEPAKKVAYLESKKMVTAAVDIDVLVLIEMTPDEEGYWQEIYDQLLASFTFIPLEGEETTVGPGPWEGAGGAGGVIEEPEEVIE